MNNETLQTPASSTHSLFRLPMNRMKRLPVTVTHVFVAISLILFITACSGERYTELMSAARDGNNDAVKRVLDLGVEINQRTSRGKTALMLAASNGHTDTVKLLLDRGADLSMTDDYGTTALIVSATGGKSDTTALLIKSGANPLLKDTSGGSALTNATFFGHTDTVKILLDSLQDLPKEDGEELLMLAAGFGHLEIAKALFAKGVSANASGAMGHSALMAATAFNKPEMVKLLLTQGADPSAKDEEGISAIDVATDKEFNDILALFEKAKQASQKQLQSTLTPNKKTPDKKK